MKPHKYSDKYLINLIKFGKTDKEIIAMLDLAHTSKVKYRKKIKALRADMIEQKPIKAGSDQLCWECKTKDCEWMYKHIPIEGWTATKTKTCGGSYKITGCPNYTEE